MKSIKVPSLFCLLMVMVSSNPVPATKNYEFADLLRKSQLAPSPKESIVVKRRIFEDNPEGELKQISIKSLVEDFEKSIFASALSLNKVITDKDFNNNTHTLEETNSDLTTTMPTMMTDTESSKTLSPEKKQQPSGVPTHIIIDRIAIQPHTGDIALIPIFELKHNRKDDSKDHEITKITISKTEITSLATAIQESSTSSSAISSTNPISTSGTTTSKSTDTVSESATTPKNIEQLKEAEEELKEKVAEIEAEPIILSARV